jgi:hypothetical protein
MVAMRDRVLLFDEEVPGSNRARAVIFFLPLFYIQMFFHSILYKQITNPCLFQSVKKCVLRQKIVIVRVRWIRSTRNQYRRHLCNSRCSFLIKRPEPSGSTAVIAVNTNGTQI